MANKQLTIIGDTAIDRIFDAWKKKQLDSLSDDDQSILNRITEVEKRFYEKKLVKDNEGKETKLGRPWKWRELVEWLMATYNISTRQAYADIEMAKEFFLLGKGRNDLEFARGYRINQGEDLMYECMEAGNYPAAASFFREIVRLDVLERKDDSGIDPGLFQPVKLEIVVDPSELGFPKIENPDQVVNNLLKSFKKGIIEKIIADSDEVSEE